jgi:hypothetical protein
LIGRRGPLVRHARLQFLQGVTVEHQRTDNLLALAVAATAALGGAAVVLAEVDDAPGGIIIGFALIAGAAALSLWTTKRAR